MLFDPVRHEPLAERASGEWDGDAAHSAVREIVRDTEQAMTVGALGAARWPLHPLDDEGDEPPSGFKGLYIGSAGVLWALWQLQREGAVRLQHDPAALLPAVHAAYVADPDSGGPAPSLFMGEAGLLLAMWQVMGGQDAGPAPRTADAADIADAANAAHGANGANRADVADVADRLHAAVLANRDHPSNEAFWGASGTLLCAWHLWRATREERWRTLWVANAERLWSTWVFEAGAGGLLWTQVLYGQRVQYLGAGHGWAGNVHPLLKGAALLDEARRDALRARCEQTLAALAQHERPDGAEALNTPDPRNTAGTAGTVDRVNWRPGTFEPRPDGPRMLMQWCHGAPGIVTALADFPPGCSAALDALLIGAGEAIWHAGPLAKGHGLCHGTAGNGLALLSLFQRTGDERWRTRARAFALHALAQREALMRQHGRGRYTLWTGDPGLALFVWQCLTGRAALPLLDAAG